MAYHDMNDLCKKNIVKTIQYLEEHRETLSINDLNCIMIYVLENENKIDCDIDEGFLLILVRSNKLTIIGQCRMELPTQDTH